MKADSAPSHMANNHKRYLAKELKKANIYYLRVWWFSKKNKKQKVYMEKFSSEDIVLFKMQVAKTNQLCW